MTIIVRNNLDDDVTRTRNWEFLDGKRTTWWKSGATGRAISMMRGRQTKSKVVDAHHASLTWAIQSSQESVVFRACRIIIVIIVIIRRPINYYRVINERREHTDRRSKPKTELVCSMSDSRQPAHIGAERLCNKTYL